MALTGLAACAEDPPAEHWRVQTPDYRPGEYLQVTGYRDVFTQVHGTPFLEPRGDFPHLVADALSGWRLDPPTRFTALPDGSASVAHKVIVTFNAQPLPLGDRLCAGTVPSTGGPTGAEILVQAVWCRGDLALSEVVRWMPADSLRAGRFHPLMAELAAVLVEPPGGTLDPGVAPGSPAAAALRDEVRETRPPRQPQAVAPVL